MIWTAAIDPTVLRVSAWPSARGFDLRDHRLYGVVDGHGVDHALLAGYGERLRLDVVRGSLVAGPVDLEIHIDARRSPALQLAALDKLLRLAGVRDPGRRPAPADRRLPRLLEALRVADALAAGASLAGIARMLAPIDAPLDWPGAGEHLKSAVRRKVALARRMVALGPGGILSHVA